MNKVISAEDAAAELLARRKARTHLADYIEYVSGKVPPRHMRFLCDKIHDCMDRKVRRLMVAMPPGHGKALALDTPIFTPSGWTTMGVLREGDYVFDDQGVPTRVVAVSPVWRNRDVFAVRTKDGEEIIADGEHEWRVRLCRKHKNWSTHDTKWIAGREDRNKDKRRAMVQIAAPLKMVGRDFIIDPYVLGVWLGDGTSSGPEFTSADQFIVDEVVRREGEVRRRGKPGNAASTYTIGRKCPPGFRTHPSLFRSRLRTLGVLNNKHIPMEYMLGSYDQRLAVVQGLMDTDGTAQKHDGQLFFTNTNQRLAEDLRTLIFSLGIKASIKETRAKLNGRDCGPVWILSFYMKDAFRLPRKAKLAKDGIKYNNRYLKAVPAGKADTVCIEVDAPTHMFLCGRSLLPTHNSTVVSHHFPAFYLSKFPDHNIISVTHTESFSETWGRKVRNLMLSPEHCKVFPDTTISEDSRAASRWDTTRGGTYYATGVGGAVVGRRGFCVIMDDVLRGIEDAESATVREGIWQWFGSDLTTRMVPDAIMIFISTRYHLDDLAGRLIAAEQQGGNKWEKIVLPAFAEKNDLLGRKAGDPLWPEMYSRDILENIKAQPAMTSRQWSSLYQQNPVPEDGSIIRKSWFKPWKQAEPPKCDYVLSSWDTAVSNKSTSAYSACTTWGVFSEPETNLPAMILLSATRGRWLYPDLRKMAQRMAFNYMDDKFDRPMLRPSRRAPDQILVEDRSSGSQLIADLMRAGISVIKVNPSRHGTKDARLMLASDILENGRVYVPYAAPLFTMPPRWCDDFVTELSSFPAAASRDYADSYSQAVDRVKQIGVVRNTEDPWSEEIPRQQAKEAYY